jgi:hypothetical protein
MGAIFMGGNNMPEITPVVDNSSATPSPAPVTPEPVVTEPVVQSAPAQTFEPGSRDPKLLEALLQGADPNSLFKQPTPAAPVEPQPPVTPPATPPAQPPQPDPAVEPQVDIPDKFKNPDGSVNVPALAKSYIEAQKLIGDQGNRLGQVNQLINEFQQMKSVIEQLQQGGQPPAQVQQPGQPQQQPQPEPELTEEQELELYYENPVAYQKKQSEKLLKQVQNMLQEGLKPVVPLVQENLYNKQVATYQEQVEKFVADPQHGDFYELLPLMQNVIDQNPWIEQVPNAVEVAYNMAKGMRPAPPPPPTVEQLLQDQNYRQKILSDPTIQAEIRKSYVQDVQQGAPPMTIGSQPGGVSVSTPAERPKSAREAGTMLARMFRGS